MHFGSGASLCSAAVSARLSALDRRLLVAMRTRMHGPLLERAAIGLGRCGEYGAIWFVIGLVGAILDSGDRDAWLVMAAIGPVAIGVNFAIKAIVRRPRPVLEGLPPLAGAPSSLSFPSAHATSSFAAAVAIWRISPELGPFALLLAVLLWVGRPYLGMHYPSDVLAGAVLGVLLGLIVPLSL
jgi:decaprenylphosphoryl-5-phosphoribose phosphatase